MSKRICIISVLVCFLSICGAVVIVMLYAKQPSPPIWAHYVYGLFTFTALISFILGPASLIISFGFWFVIRNDTYYGKRVESNPARILIWRELRQPN
ncbi:hypothetical protein LP7551_02397 [Roseibium album]|nr:hypothetical protein LP7551_02397 [Roseibium album]